MDSHQIEILSQARRHKVNDREEDEAEEILNCFEDWVRENCPLEIIRWGKACLPYEYWKLLYFKKQIRKCAVKGWMQGLREAIDGYKEFVSRIKKEWDRMKIIWARSNDSRAGD